jgi:chemotaxis signal transduction protein
VAPTPSRVTEYLTFRVGGADLAMRASCIKAFLPWGQLEPPTGAEVTDLAGFATWNGRLFPVIDLARALGLRSAPKGRTPCIVIVELCCGDEHYLSGFVADVVSDVISVRSRDLHGDTLRKAGRPRRVIDPEHYLRWRG